MAKDEELDMGSFDDEDMDFGDIDGLDDFDTNFGGVDSKDKTITGSIKNAFFDSIESAKDDKLGTAKDFLSSSVPYQISGEIDDIKDIYGSVRDETEKSIKAIRSSAKGALDAVSKAIPEDSTVSGILKKISDKLDTGESEGGSKGPSKEQQQADQIKAALAETLGEFKKAEDINTLIERDLEAKRHATTEDLLKHIYTETMYTRKFHYDVTNAYYRKSLELQFKQLYTMQELTEVTKASYQGFKVQYEAIVKNTALPDIIKLRKLPMSTKIMEDLKGRLRDDTVGELYQSFDPIKQFKKNIVDKVKNFGSNVAGGLAEATGMIDMSAEMLAQDEEFGQTRTEVLTSLLIDSIKGKAANMVGSKLIGTTAGKKGQAELYRLMGDPKAYMEAIAREQEGKESMGLLGKAKHWVARTVTDNVSGDRRATLEFNKRNLDDATIFDNRAHQALVKVIPMLLGKIYGEIKSIRTGDTSPENNEIYYDNKTESFLTSKQIVKNAKQSVSSAVNNTVRKNVTTLLNFVIETVSSKGGKPLKISNELFDVMATGIANYYTTAGSPSFADDSLSKVADFMLKDKENKNPLVKQAATTLKDLTKQFKEIADKDPDLIRTFISYAKNIRTNLPNMHKLYKDWHDQGYTHLLEKQGIGVRDSSGRLNYDPNRDTKNIMSTLNKSGFREDKDREGNEGSKEEKAQYEAYTKFFKDKINKTSDKFKELTGRDADGNLNIKAKAKSLFKQSKEFLGNAKLKGAKVLKDGTIKLMDGTIIAQDEVAKIYAMSPEERTQYIKTRFNQAKDAASAKAQEGFNKLDTKLESKGGFISKLWKKGKKSVKSAVDKTKKEYNAKMEVVNKYLEDTGFKASYTELKELADAKKQITEEHIKDLEENGDSYTEEEIAEKEATYKEATEKIDNEMSNIIGTRIEETKKKGGLLGFVGKIAGFAKDTKTYITDTTAGQKIKDIRALGGKAADALSKDQLYGYIASGKGKVSDFIDSNMPEEYKKRLDTIHKNVQAGAKEIESKSKELAKKGYDKLPEAVQKDLDSLKETTKEVYQMASKGEINKEQLEQYKNTLKAKKDAIVKSIKELPDKSKEAIDKLKEKSDSKVGEIKQWADEQGVTDELKSIKEDATNKAKSIDQVLTRGYGGKALSLIKKGANYLKLTPKSEEEAKAEFFASNEFKTGQCSDFRVWCRVMGYRIKGAAKRGLQKFLSVTRAVDKFMFSKTVGAMWKLIKPGKGGILGKLAKGGIKGGFTATWKTASLALDMLPFGMGQAMKLPLMVMGSAADAISKTKMQEQQKDTGRKMGYLSRLDYFFKRRSADGRTGIVDSVKKNKSLKWAGIGMGIMGLLKMFGLSFNDISAGISKTIDVVKNVAGVVGKGFSKAKEYVDKFLGWFGFGDTSSFTSGLFTVMAAFMGLKFLTNPLGTIGSILGGSGKLAFLLGKGGFKAVKGVVNMARGKKGSPSAPKPKGKVRGKFGKILTLGGLIGGSTVAANALGSADVDASKTKAGADAEAKAKQAHAAPDPNTKTHAANNSTAKDVIEAKPTATPAATANPVKTPNPKVEATVRAGNIVAGIAGGIAVDWFVNKMIQQAIENGEPQWKIAAMKGFGWAVSTAAGAFIVKGLNFVAQKIGLLSTNLKVVRAGAEIALKKGGGKIAAKLVARLAAYAASCTGLGALLTIGMAAWDLGWILKYVFVDDMSWKSAISLQILGIDLWGEEYKQHRAEIEAAAKDETEREQRRLLLQQQLDQETEENKQRIRNELEAMAEEDKMRAAEAERVAAWREVEVAAYEAKQAQEGSLARSLFGWVPGVDNNEEASARKLEELRQKLTDAFWKLKDDDKEAILTGKHERSSTFQSVPGLLEDLKKKYAIQAEFDRVKERFEGYGYSDVELATAMHRAKQTGMDISKILPPPKQYPNGDTKNNPQATTIPTASGAGVLPAVAVTGASGSSSPNTAAAEIKQQAAQDTAERKAADEQRNKEILAKKAEIIKQYKANIETTKKAWEQSTKNTGKAGDKDHEAKMNKALYPHVRKLFETLELKEQIDILKGRENPHDFSPEIIEMLRKDYKDLDQMAQNAPDNPTPVNLADGAKPNEYVKLQKGDICGPIKWELLTPQFRAKINAFATELYNTTGEKLIITSGARSVGDQIRLWEAYFGGPGSWTGDKKADLAKPGYQKGAMKGKVAYPNPLQKQGHDILKQVGWQEFKAKYADKFSQKSAHGYGTAIDVGIHNLAKNKVIKEKGDVYNVGTKHGRSVKPHPILDSMLARHGIKRPFSDWYNGGNPLREYWHWEDASGATIPQSIKDAEIAVDAHKDSHISGLPDDGKPKSDTTLYKPKSGASVGNSTLFGSLVNYDQNHYGSTTTKKEEKKPTAKTAVANANNNSNTRVKTPDELAKEAVIREQQEMAARSKAQQEAIGVNVPTTTKTTAPVVPAVANTSTVTANTPKATTPTQTPVASPTAANKAPAPQPVKVVNDTTLPATVPGSTTATKATTATDTPIVAKLDGELITIQKQHLELAREQLTISKATLNAILELKSTTANVAATANDKKEIDATKEHPKTGEPVTTVPEPVIDLKRQETFVTLYNTHLYA